jgi:hypothetical protein
MVEEMFFQELFGKLLQMLILTEVPLAPLDRSLVKFAGQWQPNPALLS